MTSARDSDERGFVNVKPVIVADTPDAHQVWLDVGCQHFTVGDYHETKKEAERHARMLRNAISNIKGPSVDEMVNRFLGWKLPEDFAPDHGISFVRNEFHDRHGMPTGTNLLHAGQAKEMFQHCVAWQASASRQGESRPDEAARDAARYRWFRKANLAKWPDMVQAIDCGDEHLDAAIDEAMQQDKSIVAGGET